MIIKILTKTGQCGPQTKGCVRVTDRAGSMTGCLLSHHCTQLYSFDCYYSSTSLLGFLLIPLLEKCSQGHK